MLTRHAFALTLTFLLSSNAMAQVIQWQPCKSNAHYQCSSLFVPLDYKKPELGHIKLPIIRIPATGKKIGTLYYNSGGPWGNFVRHLQKFYQQRVPNSLKEHFDWVTFNPRTVKPNAVNCTAKNMNPIYKNFRQIVDTYTGTTAGMTTYYDAMYKQRKLCHYSPIYQYASTKLTTQDLEVFRQALGAKKLGMYTCSYGTRLALDYLIKHPQKVWRVILDGNMAPNNNFGQYYESWANGFEENFKLFFELCAKAKESCPLYHSKHPTLKTAQEMIQAYQGLLTKAQKTGVATSEKYNQRPLTAAMLSILVSVNMETSKHWPMLAKGLNQAITDNKADLLMSQYIQKTKYQTKSNTYPTIKSNGVVDQSAATMCQDYDTSMVQTKKQWLTTAEKMQKKSPLIGGVAAMPREGHCINWPAKNNPLLPNTFTPVQSEARVLLIGNKHDPITPLFNTRMVRLVLNAIGVQNHLLIWAGAGHTALLDNVPDKGCTFNAAKNFYTTGNFPSMSICYDWKNPFK